MNELGPHELRVVDDMDDFIYEFRAIDAMNS